MRGRIPPAPDMARPAPSAGAKLKRVGGNRPYLSMQIKTRHTLFGPIPFDQIPSMRSWFSNIDSPKHRAAFLLLHNFQEDQLLLISFATTALAGRRGLPHPLPMRLCEKAVVLRALISPTPVQKATTVMIRFLTPAFLGDCAATAQIKTWCALRHAAAVKMTFGVERAPPSGGRGAGSIAWR